MAPRQPYRLIRRGTAIDARFFHSFNLGERLAALADGRRVALEYVDAVPLREPVGRALKVTAIGPAGSRPEVLGYVVRPDLDGLRDRVALALALAADSLRPAARTQAVQSQNRTAA